MEKRSTLASAFFQKRFLSVFILVVNVLSWYFPLYIFLENIFGEAPSGSTLLLLVFGVQFAAAIGFGILGTTLVKKFPSTNAFLVLWIFIGVISSMSIVTLETFNTTNILLVSLLLGFALGLGLPSSFEYFGNQSTLENRGVLAGITFLASMLSIFIIGLLLSFSTLFVGALILAVWRGVGLVLFLIARPKREDYKEKLTEVSYKTVLADRSFLLYLFPWAMFCLINFIEIPIEINLFGGDFATFMPIVEYGIGGFVALLGGWFADSIGRKRIIIIGFILLGIGYAILGLFSWFALARYLYIIIDGIAWGIFLPMFFLVIWSELAGNRIKGKYYLIGLIPFLIASYAQIVVTPFVEEIIPSAAFSLASFFLFIAVLPLLYAPETMPQKQIELKRLKKFADEAKKAKEKYEKKFKD
jgi:MFS family permease